MFDPTLPAEGRPLQSAVMRSQLTSLHAEIVRGFKETR